MLIFDKTEVPIKGELVVKEIISNSSMNFDQNKILKIGASLAKNSEHPLFKAIVNKSKELKIELVEMAEFREISERGLGASCKQHKTKLFLGNKKLFIENKFNIEWIEKVIDQYSDSEAILYFVSHGEHVIGAFLLLPFQSSK